MTVRWGIIGCGDVTEVKSGPAFRRSAGSELTMVMRRDGDKCRDYAARHGVPAWTTDANELIASDQVDAVYIATPPSTHAAYVKAVAARRKPVLVEKPMALNLGECDAMIEACADAGVPLFVAFYRRCLPRFERMRKLVEVRAIGEPRLILVRHISPLSKNAGWRVDPATNGGGIFVDVQAHTLDWLDHVFGEPEDAVGLIANQGQGYPAEDTVVVSLRWPGGLSGTMSACYAADRREDEVTIIGTEGRMAMSFFAPSPIRITHIDGGEQIIDLPDPPDVHQPLIQAIVADLEGGAPSPSTGETARRTTALIDRLYASWRGTRN
ncbi:MAG: Gfo/Idh/MocA family protein [Geminicoccaceae bacterium]